MSGNILLEIKDLVVRFYTYQGVVQALEGVDLEIRKGETFGLVGETGCGKTLTALSALVLVPAPGRIEKGSISFFPTEGKPVELLKLRGDGLRRMRGQELSMVFQEPGAALNPVYTIMEQIAEAFLLYRRKNLALKALGEVEQVMASKGAWAALIKPFYRLEKRIYRRMAESPNPWELQLLSWLPLGRRLLWRIKRKTEKMVIELLREMEIPDPERVTQSYPHELSGGMKQRVVIAIALASNPQLPIADEPTTSLDVTIQAQIIELLRRLKAERGSSLLYITHNLGIIAQICDRVGVMYAGSLCEVAEVKEIFSRPLHPYTKALIEVIPKTGAKLSPIPGTVPDLIHPPPGCRFHPRCPYTMEICRIKPPPLKEVKAEHKVACYLY